MVTSAEIHKPDRWDIFCRVIDNYGDIGVCWRLARQLVNEHNLQVRLWLDDITPLLQLEPDCNRSKMQVLSGIEVYLWDENTHFNTIGDVVIEAFACDIPPDYLALMKLAKADSNPPCWINLEYLSAENWVEDCHKMLSIEPNSGLKKAFFFPGFSPKTGGVLREESLLMDRDVFLSDKSTINNFFESLGIRFEDRANKIIISLFGYENAAVNSLLKTWIEGEHPIICLIPEGKILSSVSDSLQKQLSVGARFEEGNLLVKVIPFIPQVDYDKLLWACDLNFIRGEDSFVRAQWAQKPFIWHIYPQDEDVHIEKLEAFLTKLSAFSEKDFFSVTEKLWLKWNKELNIENEWNQYVKFLYSSEESCKNWVEHLNSLGNLTSNMVQFCQKPL